VSNLVSSVTLQECNLNRPCQTSYRGRFWLR